MYETLPETIGMVLRYFGIRVMDLERSIDFYTGLLKLKLARKGTMYHGGKWVLLEDPRSHQRLELNWYPRDSPYAGDYVAGEGLDHIGFKVKDPKAEYKRLVAGGAKSVLSPSDENGVKRIYYVADPDGNWIELY